MARRLTRKRKPIRKLPKRRFKRSRYSRLGRFFNWPHWRKLIIGMIILLLAYVVYLDVIIRISFEGKRWALPAHVYARPLEIYPGLKLSASQYNLELERLGYRYHFNPGNPGTYNRQNDRFTVIKRSFQFWDGLELSRKLDIRFDGGQVESLRDLSEDKELTLARMDPPRIGGIYPAHHEDRILIQLQEAPGLLRQALIAVEDRNFQQHIGLDPRAIARAIWVNFTGSGGLQGGSTLTQQLVKNFFLSNKRTLWRKFNEAIMALLLEAHYDKDEILEAYLNEVYLGQDGRRAIHGFGLASRFYFDKPIEKLNLPEIALMVAMIRGPGYYHPYRYPDRLLERRNLVLTLMNEQGAIEKESMLSAKQQPLGVIQDRTRVGNHYPAFMDLVRRQLKRDYREEDLTSEGLRIFTTFDPWVQSTIEQTADSRIAMLDQQHGLKGELQAAIIVANPSNGEILALLGNSKPGLAGFNRALDAQRPVGSLIKPAVYLTALEQANKYNLLSLVDDSPISLQDTAGETWSPKNYDGKSHGKVPMYQALVNSYNQATVRLGMWLGFEAIENVLYRLGVDKRIPPYPSMLLGAIEMSPMDIAQMYQTLAAGGFRTPLRAIREVMTADGQPLQRYPINVQQTIDSKSIAVLSSVMQEIMRSGTGRGVRSYLSDNIELAGKTGTTDELRDSWFAGYSSDYLGIVWLGTDDNKPIHLSGSSGALQVWGDMMQGLRPRSLLPIAVNGVEVLPIDLDSYLVGGSECYRNITLAFVEGTAPEFYADCAGGGKRQD
ncbi:MAG: penicillin-binding protein 1B [Gammaproteobacteria bacterium]|nr:penicillin-binding protein 1B [Gammaproteobacteria bacterium]